MIVAGFVHQHRLRMCGCDISLCQDTTSHRFMRSAAYRLFRRSASNTRGCGSHSTIPFTHLLFIFQVLLKCTSSATAGVKRCAVSKSPRVHMSPSSAPEWRFAGDRDTRVISGLSRLLARGRSLTSPVPRGLRRRLARGDFEWLGQPAMRGFV